MTIFVSGANGLIGRAVVARFREEGFAVCPVSLRGKSLDELHGFMKRENAQNGTFIHLAAAVPGGRLRPDNQSLANATRQLDITAKMISTQFNMKALYASTCAIYPPTTEKVKYVESDGSNGHSSRSPYVNAKAQGEENFLESVDTTVLRISGAVGIGLSDFTVLGTFLARARRARPIQLWGAGTREQNYVDVRDIASAFVAAYKSDKPGIYNVCSGRAVTMEDLARTIVRAVPGSSYEFAKVADPLEGIRAGYSNEAALTQLSWAPQVSLDDSLAGILRE